MNEASQFHWSTPDSGEGAVSGSPPPEGAASGATTRSRGGDGEAIGGVLAGEAGREGRVRHLQSRELRRDLGNEPLGRFATREREGSGSLRRSRGESVRALAQLFQ